MFRYWGHYTDAAGDPVDLDVHMRAHAHVEDHIRRLKDSGANRFPFTDIDANRAWLAVVCFADALVRWFQQLCLTGTARHRRTQDAALEPLAHPRPASSAKPAATIVRILDGWPTANALLDAYQRIALII